MPDRLRALVVQLMDSHSGNDACLCIYLQQTLSHVPEERQGRSVELCVVNRRYRAAVQAFVQQGVDEAPLRPAPDARGGCDCG